MGLATNACETCCSNVDAPSELCFGSSDNTKPGPNELRSDRKSSTRTTNKNRIEVRQSRSGLNGIPAPVGNSNKKGDLAHFGTDDVLKIIRMQALVRGFLDRRRFAAFKRELSTGTGNYFAREELLETAQN